MHYYRLHNVGMYCSFNARYCRINCIVRLFFTMHTEHTGNLLEKKKTHRVADKALVNSSDGSPVVQEAVVARVSVPRSVSECWVQLNHVALSREHKLSRVTVDNIVRIKQL